MQSNGGLTLQVHIDYLVGVLAWEDDWRLEQLIRLISEYVGERIVIDWRKPLYRGEYWEASGQATNGTMIAVQKPDKGEDGRLWVSIPGRPLSAMKWERQQRMIEGLAALQFKATRVDIATDVPRSAHSREDLEKAIDAQEYMPFRSHQQIKSRRGNKLGWCYYLGQASGIARMCIYDKFAESDGAIDAIRWEFRGLDERARSMFGYIAQNGMESESAWCQALASLWVAAVDFRQSAPGQRKARASQPEWWAAIVAAAGAGVRPAVERLAVGVLRTCGWLKKQVVGTLQMLHEAAGAAGVDLVRSLLERDAPLKLTKARLAVIDVWRRELDTMGIVSAGCYD